ncbi:MAG TPA: protein kinase [Gemmatimonadales bacterium]|nr:protein kinase [Gemmatimonadales bacterium]
MSTPIDRLTAALSDRYRLERELGQGGMATVYLAEDLKHDRKVALKVLKPELAAVLGAERFVVEIRTTAALQHPHILPLFDSGTADGFLFYVMPFIQGETLRSKLDRETQLSIDEAVKLTVAVADALDYAHRQGVIHRDIKPENILLHDGRPMVADFGIALAVSAAAGGRMTETGLSLGTPHYMSPEQATGEREISARSDVYSLGSVLYEMLTGSPPHTGASAQQIIMKIVTEDAAPVTKLRRAVPPNVAAAIAKSLEKLPADRFATAREFGEALRDTGFTVALSAAGTAGRSPVAAGRWRSLAVAASAAALIATAAAVWAARRPQPTGPVGRYRVRLDSAAPLSYVGAGEPGRLAMTADGRELVYVGEGAGRARQLFVRPLGSLESRAIPGTRGTPTVPVVSWDGSQVAFLMFSPSSIRVASLRGGPPLTLADSGFQSSPAWGPGGFVYFVGNDQMVRRVPGGGGPPEDVATIPPPAKGGRYRWLNILPSARGALVAEQPGSGADDAQYRLHVVDLKTGRISTTLQGVSGYYVADAGALVYVAPEGTLLAVPFDLGKLSVRGRPVPLFGNLSVRGSQTDLAIAGGTLAYTLPGVNSAETLMWVDRSGAVTPVDTAWHDPELEAYALSPDGARLAIGVESAVARLGQSGPASNARMDIRVKQMDRGPVSRLTFGGQENASPAWTADGQYVSYSSNRDGRWSLWRRRADGVGPEELVADVGRNVNEARWSADGAWLVVAVGGPPSRDILVMRLGTDSTLRPLLAESYEELQPSISPDGRWLAYVSTETGEREVFVRPFPEVDQGKWQISQGGGQSPLWSRDGRELFYRSDENTVDVADMARGPALAAHRVVLHAPAGTRFERNNSDRLFDVSRDGRRFLLVTSGEGDTSGDLVLVENFVTELRAALAAGNGQ